MKIGFAGINLPEGSHKYEDPILGKLAELAKPAKVTSYFFTFLQDNFSGVQAATVSRESIWDILIGDLEKIENRLARAEDEQHRSFFDACRKHLESEQPLCDMELEPEQRAELKAMDTASFNPTVVLDKPPESWDTVCPLLMEKAGRMFFYTSGPREVRSWFVPVRATAIECAAQIHSDLARGFIKAEIIPFEKFQECHSFKDAAQKGLTKLVDRDEPVPPETVLEIRFNV